MAKDKEAASAADWDRFERVFKAEMNDGDTVKELDLLALLSKTANFSVGCYCEDESRCHRSILRQLLIQRGADVK